MVKLFNAKTCIPTPLCFMESDMSAYVELSLATVIMGIAKLFRLKDTIWPQNACK